MSSINLQFQQRGVSLFNAYLIGVLLLVTTNCVQAQYKDLNSFSNLYIITVDNSGSMKWDRNGQSNAKEVPVITGTTYEKLLRNDLLASKLDFKKDRFIFFNSGLFERAYRDQVLDYRQLERMPRFDTSFIHHTDTLLHSFHNRGEFLTQVRYQLLNDRYASNLSFVSQIRLFSLIKALTLVRAKSDLAAYQHIFLLTITDDADQNDQWMGDYKTMEKYAPVKLREMTGLIDEYLYNPFSRNKHDTQQGAFVFLNADTPGKPKVYFDEYVAGRSAAEPIHAQLFRLTPSGVDALVLQPIAERLPKGDQVDFYHISGITVNGNRVGANSSFAGDTTLAVRLSHGLGFDQVIISGYVQVIYRDPVLGKRYQQIPFIQKNQVQTALLSTVIRFLMIGLLLLLITGLTWYFVLRPRKTSFRIYDTLGNVFLIRRGLKAYGKDHFFKPGGHTLLSYTISGAGMEVLVKRHRNIHRKSHTWTDPKHGLLIVSAQPLSLHGPHEHYAPGVDIDEFLVTREYHELLRARYQTDMLGKLNRLRRRMKHKWNPLYKAARYMARRAAGKHYYLCVPELKVNSVVSYSAKDFQDTTFMIRYQQETVPIDSYPNRQRNIACLNHFYEQGSAYADSMLTGNLIGGQMIWNVLKLDFQFGLQTIHEIYRFEMTYPELDGATIATDASLLKKLALTRLGAGSCCIYYTTGTADRLPVLKGGLHIAVPSAVGNGHSFTFSSSTYLAFLLLVETRDDLSARHRLLYDPFDQGLYRDIMTKSPDNGTYHLYSCFAPGKVPRGLRSAYLKKLAHNLFMFEYPMDAMLTIEPEKMGINYCNQKIQLKAL